MIVRMVRNPQVFAPPCFHEESMAIIEFETQNQKAPNTLMLGA